MNLKNTRLIGILLLGLASAIPAGAAVVVPERIQAEINQAVAQESRAYDVDAEKSKSMLDRVDTLFEARMDVKQAVSRTSRKQTRQSFRRNMTKNDALTADAGAKAEKTLDPGKAFDVFYIKKPMQRSFTKAIEKPALQGLEEDEVVALGKKFIQTRQLCPLEENDGLGNAVVVDRKKQAMDSETRQEYVVSQKVRFTRTFQGMEVVNARQSVEVHPETREILGYKVKDWGAIKSGSGKTHAPRAAGEVMQALTENFKKSARTFEASKVKTALYQTDTKLIPVMLVYFDVYEAKSDEAIPEEEVLIVSMAKDIELPAKTKNLRSPK